MAAAATSTAAVMFSCATTSDDCSRLPDRIPSVTVFREGLTRSAAAFIKTRSINTQACTSISPRSSSSIVHGVAIGAGWQALIANVNIITYYVFGVPFGLFIGYTLDMGVKGIWYGTVAGTVVQTITLFWIVY